MAFQTPITIIRGSGGGWDFSHYGGTNGKIMEKIGVWAVKSRIKDIKVWLIDEAPKTFGDPSQPFDEGSLQYKEFSFEYVELNTCLSLWGNDAGTKIGWIYFEMNCSQQLNFGMYSWDKKQEYLMDVGPSICVGVLEGAGFDMDNLVFVFLKLKAYSKLVNVEYPRLSFDTRGISPKTLKEFNHTNNTNSVDNSEFSGSTEVTITSTWKLAIGLAMHAIVMVEVGIPLVANVTEDFRWKLSTIVISETSSSTMDTMSWKLTRSLEPGKSVNICDITGHGVISIPYTRSIKVTLKPDTTFQYPSKG